MENGIRTQRFQTGRQLLPEDALDEPYIYQGLVPRAVLGLNTFTGNLINFNTSTLLHPTSEWTECLCTWQDSVFMRKTFTELLKLDSQNTMRLVVRLRHLSRHVDQRASTARLPVGLTYCKRMHLCCDYIRHEGPRSSAFRRRTDAR